MDCHFCGFEIPKGKGIMYVKANGVIMYFCSSKCKKNALNLRRKGRDWKWTKAYREFKAAYQRQESKTM